jgi:opacity protein-like surface antigen
MSATNKNSRFSFAATGLALLASGAASAANPGWFGGIRIGTPGVDVPVANLAEEPDATLTVFRFPIRLKLGMEIGLRDQAVSSAVVPPGVGLRLPGDDHFGWQVLGIGSVPITKNWGVFGKLGAYRWQQDLGSNFTSIGTTEARPTYGLGLKYDFTGNLSVSGEWDRYQLGPGSGTRSDAEIDLLSIGLKYRF